MKNFTFVVCALVALLSGCSSLKNSDLVGSYKDSNALGVITLDLKQDGTFSQVAVMKSGKRYTSAGKWKFNGADNRISIDEILFFRDLRFVGKPRLERGSFNTSVEGSAGEIHIIINSDENIFFEKTKQ